MRPCSARLGSHENSVRALARRGVNGSARGATFDARLQSDDSGGAEPPRRSPRRRSVWRRSPARRSSVEIGKSVSRGLVRCATRRRSARRSSGSWAQKGGTGARRRRSPPLSNVSQPARNASSSPSVLPGTVSQTRHRFPCPSSNSRSAITYRTLALAGPARHLRWRRDDRAPVDGSPAPRTGELSCCTDLLPCCAARRPHLPLA